MKKLLIALLLIISPVARATDLDKIKILAGKLDLVYTGVSDRMGEAYYLFYWPSVPHILVAILADVRDDHEAIKTLEAGLASAIRTNKPY